MLSTHPRDPGRRDAVAPFPRLPPSIRGRRSTPIEIVIFFIIIIVALAVWFATTQTARSKGKRGEKRVSTGLGRALDDAVYRVVDDVTLPTRNGTTQIDHLVVSPHGVFVIETKNVSGWIFGREEQQQWTQVLYRRKSRFFNPIRQNYTTSGLCSGSSAFVRTRHEVSSCSRATAPSRPRCR